MTKFKKLLVVLLMAVMMMGVASVVLATDENVTFIPDEGANATTNTNIAGTNELFNNTNTNTNQTNNTNNANSSQYNNSNLPKAGSTDGMMIMIIVAVFGISALYAYKKIKDYNLR